MSRSGEALYYRTDRRMMAVDAATATRVRSRRARVLFEGSFHYKIVPSRTV